MKPFSAGGSGVEGLMGQVLTIVMACVFVLAGCARPTVAEAQPPASTPPAQPGMQDTPVARGEFLVRVGGCNDCHTPQRLDPALGVPVPDMTRKLSGHPSDAPDPTGTLGEGDQAIIGATFTSFKAPFGVVYAANLTSDPTGIGGWTEEQFVQAMKTGRHLGTGRPVLPPMPWMALATLSETDLAAMYAYLMTVPPVANTVPAPKVEQAAMDRIGQVSDTMRARMQHGPK